MLKPCSVHTLRMNICPSRALFTTLVLYCGILCKFTDGEQDVCIHGPQNNSQQCQRMRNVQIDSDKMVEHYEMELSKIHEIRTSLLATPLADKHVNLNSRHLRQQQRILIHTAQLQKAQCSDRDSCNADVQWATTTLHTPTWFTSLTRAGKDIPVRHAKFHKEMNYRALGNTPESQFKIAVGTKCSCLLK